MQILNSASELRQFYPPTVAVEAIVNWSGRELVGLVTATVLRERRSHAIGQADAIRIVRGDRDAGHLCAGEPEQVVHPGLCGRVSAWLGLWIPAGSLAFWSGRGSLGSGCCGALESIEKPTLMGDAETSSFALNLETPLVSIF